MAYSKDTLRHICDKTSSRCHICWKKVAWKNYGIVGARMAWEVDHSNPRARGGSDRTSNKQPLARSHLVQSLEGRLVHAKRQGKARSHAEADVQEGATLPSERSGTPQHRIRA